MDEEQQGPTPEQWREWIAIPNPFGVCQKGPPRDLERKGRESEHIIVRGGCNAWGCPVCGPRKRFRFAKHFAQCLACDGRPIQYETVPKRKWQAFHKRIKRAEGSYVRFSSVDGWAVLFVTDTPRCESPIVGVQDIATRVGELMRRLMLVHRPVDSSNNWKMIRQESDYKLIRFLPKKMKKDELMASLKEKGLTVQELPPRNGSQWVIRYHTELGATLVYKDGIFTVVGADDGGVSKLSTHQETEEAKFGQIDHPVFSVEFGEDGPELVVSA